MNTGALAACVAAARGVCTFGPTLAPLLRRIAVGHVIGLNVSHSHFPKLKMPRII
jgi:hypothetical protein